MQRVSFLQEEIYKHKILYYSGKAKISDEEFDSLEEELKTLDPTNPVLSMVGSDQFSGEKIKHDTKMLSLNKTYKLEELKNWMGDNPTVSMFKLDGVSCSLVYESGTLTLSKTRGDGSFGENILDKVLWVESVKKSIKEKEKVEIRGELFCTEENFISLADEMERLGLEKPNSQRNIVAGLIGRKDYTELSRFLSFQAFDWIEDEKKFKSEMEKFKGLKAEGFDTPEVILHKNDRLLQGVIDEAQSFMGEGEYQIDGIVFSYDNLDLHEELGSTAHHPRYKMAFKFQGEAKATVIKDILWNVSRNGTLTPIAHVKPVELSGAKISRVTLHNFGMVNEFELKKGDRIEIIRSGEVIPKFISLLESSSEEYSFPKSCPSCNKKVDVVDIRLICNNPGCPAQVSNQILNFVQKIGIDDLSTKRLEEMINTGLVKKISDLYELEKDDFFKLDKVKEKLADKLHKSIQKSKTADFITLLSSIGIRSGGRSKCEKVVEAGFDSLDKLKNLSEEKLSEVEGFAQKSASEFLVSLRELFPLLDNLVEQGFDSSQKELSSDGKISGLKFVITGSLSQKRSVIEKKIKDNGGQVVGSVSSATNYLVTNDTESSSSKFKKAKQLGIPIISEEKLEEML